MQESCDVSENVLRHFEMVLFTTIPDALKVQNVALEKGDFTSPDWLPVQFVTVESFSERDWARPITWDYVCLEEENSISAFPNTKLLLFDLIGLLEEQEIINQFVIAHHVENSDHMEVFPVDPHRVPYSSQQEQCVPYQKSRLKQMFSSVPDLLPYLFRGLPLLCVELEPVLHNPVSGHHDRISTRLWYVISSWKKCTFDWHLLDGVPVLNSIIANNAQNSVSVIWECKSAGPISLRTARSGW